MYKNYDVESGAYIRSGNNELDIKYLISCIERVFDLESQAIAVFSKDLESYTSWIEPVRTDLPSSVYIPYIYEMLGSAKINERNILDIIYKLAQAPVLHLKEYLVQDTYLREGRPTLNYGTAESIIVGSALEGNYRSLIQLDLYNYNHLQNAMIIGVELVLDVSGAYDINQTIDAYEVYSDWNENNITWASANTAPTQLNISATPVFSFNVTDSLIRINVRQFADRLKSENKTKFNIMLRARNEDADSLFNFFSKDTQIVDSKPYLDVRYQDLAWTGYIGDGNIDGQATVRLKSNKENLGSAIVRRKAYDDSLLGSVLVGRWMDKDLSQQAVIRRSDSTDLTQDATIVYSEGLPSDAFVLGRKEIDGSAFILHGKNLDGDANVLPSTNLNSDALILYSKDLDSWIVLTHKQDLDVDAFVRGYKFLEGQTVITHKVDLEGSALVGNWESSDIDGTVNIKGIKELLSSVNIYQKSELYGSAMVGQWYEEDLEGDATSTPTTNITGQINVTHKTELDSNAVIQLTDKTDIDGSSTTRLSDLKDLDGDATILISLDMEGNVVVRPSTDLESSIIINKYKDLESLANIFKTLDLGSQATITRKVDNEGNAVVTIKSDLVSVILIGNWSNSDLDQQATISNWRAKDLEQQATVVYSKDLSSSAAVFRTKDLNGNVFVRQKTDLDGTANALKNATILGQAVVRQKGIADLDHDSIVRQFDITEIDSYVYAIGPFVTALVGEVIVRKIGRDYLDCEADINTRARRWIPNVHGQDVFHYQDRKLPRVWKREQFIP